MSTRRAHGIDISYWQRDFDIKLVSADDLDFAILKASQMDWTDTAFETLNAATGSIPIRGAYHYYVSRKYETSHIKSLPESKKGKKEKKKNKKKDRKKDRKKEKGKNKETEIKVLVKGKWTTVLPSQITVTMKDGPGWQVQADQFIKTVGGKGFHFYALDIEPGPNIKLHIGQLKNVFTSEDLVDIQKWIDYVAEKTEKPVLLYTSPSVYGDLLKPHDADNKLDGMKLWLAAYDLGDREKTDPIRVTGERFKLKRPEKDWTFWQYSADKNKQGAKYGLPAESQDRDIDLNVYNGTIDELSAWIGHQVLSTGDPIKDTKDEETSQDTDLPEKPQVVDTPVSEPPYPGLTNQDIINIFNRAANSTNWWDWVVLADLEGLAASPEARKQTYTGPKFEDLPGLSSAQKQALLNILPGREITPDDSGLWVNVNVEKTTCKYFKSGEKGRDKQGKPIMIPHRPPVLLFKGNRVRVSETHKESDKDAGDGVIMATGRAKYYLVLESPDNPKAEKTFVLKEDTTPIPK